MLRKIKCLSKKNAKKKQTQKNTNKQQTPDVPIVTLIECVLSFSKNITNCDKKETFVKNIIFAEVMFFFLLFFQHFFLSTFFDLSCLSSVSTKINKVKYDTLLQKKNTHTQNLKQIEKGK